jgi:Uma2 family endonuclease
MRRASACRPAAIANAFSFRTYSSSGTEWSSPYYAPSDVQVAVEIVSPSSVTRDRWAKRGLYAELGIGEYWLVDPGERTLTIFSRPSAEPPREYLDHLVYAEEQLVPGLGCAPGEVFGS